MENLYFGLAAAGAIALLALFLIKRKTMQEKVSHSQAPQTHQQQSQNSKITTPLITMPPSKPTQPQTPIYKTTQQLESQYQGVYYGTFRLKSSNSIHKITAIAFKGPKILLSTTKNQLILFNLKQWKKDQKNNPPPKYFVSLDNNTASSVTIGNKYYYATLTFDKTIIIYQFIGEAGIYFKQVTKFARNILKSNATAIHVDSNQKYIITAGSGADTVLDVWSINGEKLVNVNTFQIQHYGVCCGMRNVLVRGWTSQVKIFSAVQEKNGGFKKLEKDHHLAHTESPLSSSICNRDMYAVTISKSNKPKIWSLFQPHHPTPSSSCSIPPTIQKCSIYTFQPAVGHFKTLIVLSHPNGFLITDINLNIIEEINGVDVSELYMNGTNKLVLLGTVSTQGQLILWNLGKAVEKVGEVCV